MRSAGKRIGPGGPGGLGGGDSIKLSVRGPGGPGVGLNARARAMLATVRYGSFRNHEAPCDSLYSLVPFS